MSTLTIGEVHMLFHSTEFLAVSQRAADFLSFFTLTSITSISVYYLCLLCFLLLNWDWVALWARRHVTQLQWIPLRGGASANRPGCGCKHHPSHTHTQPYRETHTGLLVPLWGDRAPSVCPNKGKGSLMPHLPPQLATITQPVWNYIKLSPWYILK